MWFRRKPVVVEAWEWDQREETLWLLRGKGMECECRPLKAEGKDGGLDLTILTPEGRIHVSPGGMVIKGVAGEFYACKPGVFAATHEEVGWAKKG
jgi:hypothetical protein